MQCKNFGCTNEANGYPCCDSNCGYHYKQDIRQMRKYQDGLISWRYLTDGIGHVWSFGKALYYSAQLSQQN